MTANQLYVIIHGHFYQPPREDPWTYEIDRQPSAAPFHDWNERINKQCYAANAASRILDSAGRIEDIINNYEYISFNFGPTLLSWLEKYDRFTYERIIEADRKSCEMNNGHGNAIAQVYNHVIMPLATEYDKRTQLEWGLKYFEKHFGRPSEGIWLAETAINNDTVDYLIEYGIKFVILAPTQAEKVRKAGTEEWIDVSNNSIDPSRPYFLEGKTGKLAAFFYYGDIAMKISFQHLLTKVEHFRGDLIAHNNPEKPIHLVHTATDGESYGHHEPFGDMCLSRLIYENRRDKAIQFTNYARYLEIDPPTDTVLIKPGKDDLGTAWSCAHGVGRWMTDCGCSTGGGDGWTQKWRESLRNAFDFLRDRLIEATQKELARFIPDIFAARNGYMPVATSIDNSSRKKSIEEFFKEFVKTNTSDYDKTFILRLMEALHNAMLMYTSCGWFFSEISGIEPVQNMRYAARVMELASDILPGDTKPHFLSVLSKAKSNIPDFQNGKWIYENFVDKYIFDEKKAISQYLLILMLTKDKIHLNRKENNYYFNIEITNHQVFQKEEWEIHKFETALENALVCEKNGFAIYIFRNGNNLRVFIKKCVDNSLMVYLDKLIEKDNPHSIVKDFQDWFLESYSLADIKYDYKECILSRIFEKTLVSLHKKLEAVEFNLEEYLNLITLYRDLAVSLTEKDLIAIKELLNNYILSELGKLERLGIEHYDFGNLIKTIQTAKRANLEIDYQDITPILREIVLSRMHPAIVKRDVLELKRLEIIIDFTNFAGIDFEKYEIQNLIFETIQGFIKNKETMEKQDKETVELIMRLASKFNIAVHSYEAQKLIKR